MKHIIKWEQISLILTGSKHAIRRNKIPKKYEFVINDLLKHLQDWDYDRQTINKSK